MTVCKEYEAQIGALIDNELTAEERLRVLEHIAQCPACKAYWEELLALGDALRTEAPAPAGFADAVMARVRETKQENAAEKKVIRFPGWKRFAGLAACCALVALGVWMMDTLPLRGMNTSAVSNGAAPETASMDDRMTDGGVMYNAPSDNAEDCAEADSTDASEAPPEAPCVTDDNTLYGDPGSFTALLTTGSTVAGEWVENTLGENWASGARFALTEEQYSELRLLLESEGEQFSEITGSDRNGSYLLLAE